MPSPNRSWTPPLASTPRSGPDYWNRFTVPCLHELAQRGLRTVSQQPIPVVYGAIRIDIDFRADLIVEDRVIVEITSGGGPRAGSQKAASDLLRLTGKRLGLLINFNAALIRDGITRIVNGLEEESHAKPLTRMPRARQK